MLDDTLPPLDGFETAVLFVSLLVMLIAFVALYTAPRPKTPVLQLDVDYVRGGILRGDIHIHTVRGAGVYTLEDDGTLRFEAAPDPDLVFAEWLTQQQTNSYL